MKPATEAMELYRHTGASGGFAAITYAAGPRGHVVSLHGVDPMRVRFLDIESARLLWGVFRLKLRLAGFERAKEEMRAA